MPTSRLLVSSLVCCFIGLLTFSTPALANTDPKYATPSATATVPSFSVTGDTTPPTIPILIRPTDNTITNNPRPEFVWQQSHDPDGNTVIYTLYLNSVAVYLGISNLGNSAGSNFAARLDGEEIKLTPTTSLSDGHYTWYVTASDVAGNTSRSTTWGLTIDTHAPPLTLTQLDIYPNPQLSPGTSFDIAGPKDVYFILASDPHILVQIDLVNQDGISSRLFTYTNAQGFATLYQHLAIGTYQVTALAIDGAGNPTLLPDFQLTVTQATVPLPGGIVVPLPPIIHDLPAGLAHLPATVALITTRSPLAVSLLILLAILALILIILFWLRRPNLLLLDSQLHPLPRASVYHSRPPHASTIVHLTPHHRGWLYVPHLSRYSTLTIRHNNSTVVLSLSRSSRRYTLVLNS